MKPYFDDGAGRIIYHGDSSVIVPELNITADLLLTDPPYGLGIDGQKESLHANGTQLRKGHEFRGWDNAVPADKLFDIIFAATKTHIVWGGNYFLPKLGIHKGWLVWDKGQYGLTMSDGELAYTNMDRPLRIMTLHRTHLWQESPQHPTQKPLALMKWCIVQAPSDVTTILDPFMGSGTTLVAAKAMNLGCIGIEQDERYCEIAASRLAQSAFDFTVDE